MKKELLDLTQSQFKTAAKNIIHKDYIFEQVFKWVYEKKAASFDDFTNLSKDIRIKLSENFVLRTLTIVKKEISNIDSTIRYTFKTADKKSFFAVFLPSKDSNSVCISSQIGCPAGCLFCSTGKSGFTRNLSRGEILEQILQIENDTKQKISGVLFMGMGEPAFNYNNVLSALKSLLSKKEFYIGKRHITLSTVGIVPAIKKLADENLGIRLAVSLHSVDDKQRKRVIPNNFGFSIDEIIDAAQYYFKKTNSRLTIEYILIKDFNDSPSDAHKLARLLKRRFLINPKVQVNLIPFNYVAKSPFLPSTSLSIEKFKNILKLNRITANIRQAKGADISAACGQLGY
ncbi:MAG: 23S rRNA (adenine(2503)-C(2))-methyltransferase RlmN [Elusimicrobiota bacterium]|jgi:23S rRNA (adenine2503-C2)-methyltransferase|nr:23S rRNA (adenine(2503)-C(2))-methyltransferase RlmN [Elusimicrobiota bacterium]